MSIDKAQYPAQFSVEAERGQGEGHQHAQQPGSIKILLVSYWFPPVNIVGAVRTGKLAKYLFEAGYDVRVVAACDPGDHSLPVEIPSDRVFYATGWDINRLLDPAIGALRRMASKLTNRELAQSKDGSLLASPSSARALPRWLAKHYYALLRIPDARAGWIGAAAAVGRRVVRNWRPDVIFASAPPNTSLVAAYRIARSCGAPWVAELRDLWVDNPYYEYPGWRLLLDRLMEWWVLRTAAGLVSVTPPWTESLARYRVPRITIFNGFAEEDFGAETSAPPDGDVVSIVYTGSIYPGFRDPTPLFRAINLLGPLREKIRAEFYGPAPEEVAELAAAAGVADRITIHSRVPYRTALELQERADVLLLLQWNDPKDAGNVPAKFFEYLGARRPILFHGYERGMLAQMIRERNAGLVSSDPARIADQLRQWIIQRPSGIPPVDEAARQGMSRAEQFQKLDRFLRTEVLGIGNRA